MLPAGAAGAGPNSTRPLLEGVPLRGDLHHPAEDPHAAAGHSVPRLRSVPGRRHAGDRTDDRHAAGADPLPVLLRVVREGDDGGRDQGVGGSAAKAGGELRELRAVHVGDERIPKAARLPQPHVEAARVRRQRATLGGPGEVVDAAHDEQGDGVEAPSVDGRGGAAVEEVFSGSTA